MTVSRHLLGATNKQFQQRSILADQSLLHCKQGDQRLHSVKTFTFNSIISPSSFSTKWSILVNTVMQSTVRNNNYTCLLVLFYDVLN